MMPAQLVSAALLGLLLASPMQSVSLAAEELRDPMRPPPLALQKFRQARPGKQPSTAQVKPKPAAVKPFKLVSILFAPGRQVAIIDDQLLTVGDSIRGARLVQLTRGSARLLQRGKIINLKLDDGAAAGISKKAALDKP